MPESTLEMKSFFKTVSKKILESSHEKLTLHLNELPVSGHHCHYILDLSTNKMLRKTGIRELLGYDEDRIDHDFMFNNIHPEDREIVQRITKAAIWHCIENPDTEGDQHYQLCLTYRHKTISGNYIKVLNQVSVVERNTMGIPVRIMIHLRDISFIDISCSVNWVFEAPNLDLVSFKDAIYKPFQNFFTERETEIIQEIAKGHTNKRISENLLISEHTVATHRKNIMRKSGCHSVPELLYYCNEKGILQALSA